MANISVCKGCGRTMFAFKQTNNIFYVCRNEDCKLEGLIKIDLIESLNNSQRYKEKYATM